MVSESSYTKYVVIMIIIYKVIKPNYKITRNTWGQLTLYVLNEYMYGNPINLVIQWWEINLSYDPYNILMDEIIPQGELLVHQDNMVQHAEQHLLEIIPTQAIEEQNEIMLPQFRDLYLIMTPNFITK